MLTLRTPRRYIFFCNESHVNGGYNKSMQKAYSKFINFERLTTDDTDRRAPYNPFPNSLDTKCVLDNACIIYWDKLEVWATAHELFQINNYSYVFPPSA